MTEAEIADPQASSGLCDDEGVPLICPTCQVLAQSVLAGDRLLTLHGVVFDIFVGSHSDAAWLQDSCLKAHTPTGPSLYRNGAPDTIRTRGRCLRKKGVTSLSPASPRQRAADHVRQLGLPIRLCQQQHAGIEAALMHDGVVGID